MTTPPRSLLLVALVLVVGVVAANARLIVGGQTWADVRYHTEVAPPRMAAAAAVQAGALPAWWDGSGLGVPLAGEPSHGAMYAPAWLATTPRGLDLVAIAHLAWAALGVAVWARRRSGSAPPGASEHAALVAGLLAATTGILASAAVRGALPAIAQLPWIGWAAAWLADAADRRDRARAAAALGALIGLVGTAGVLAVLADAVVLALAIAARRRIAGWLAGALAAGLAVAAAQWLPALAQLAASAGGEPVGGLPLARLIELIVPGSFGAADPDRAVAAVAGAAPWAPSLFAGVPLLALAAVRAPPGRLRGALGVLAVLALVTGRGGWPAWLGAPDVHVAALVIVLAAHAGAGIDALVAAERRAIVALAVGTACAAVALSALAVLRARQPSAAPAIDRALLDGGLGVVSLAGALALVWRAPRRALPVLLALLVLPSAGALPSTAPVIDRAVVDQVPAWAAAAAGRDAAGRAPVRLFRPVFMTAPGSAPDSAGDAIATLAGTSAWRWGIAAARSEDPARSPSHDRAWLAAASEGGALLDRFGIALAILPDSVVAARKLTLHGRRDRWALVELPVAPAAAVMRGWSWAVADADALELSYPLGGGTGFLRGTTVLRGAGAAQPDRGPPLACAIDGWDPGDIAVTCTSPVAGYAAISSASAPGWSVSVDGEPASWLTADVLRRAVAIEPGSHRIHWRYRAPGLGVGVALAGLAVAGLLALWLAAGAGRLRKR